MFKLDDIGSYYYSLPPNMQDAYSHAFGVALDKQIKKLLILAERLRMWTDLDNADPRYYDHMAASLGAPYYKSEYDDDKKLALIKQSIIARAYAGTFTGVTDFLSAAFDPFELVPWYEYGGDPYHFKVRAHVDETEDMYRTFTKMLQKVKAVRSILDSVETVDEMEGTLYTNGGVATYETLHLGDTIT